MINRLSINKFILVFLIGILIFTPLLIRAHNKELPSVTLLKSAPENPLAQFAPLSEIGGGEGVSGIHKSQFSLRRYVSLSRQQGLKPKIGNR